MNNTPAEKARELIEKYKRYTNQQSTISYDYNLKEHLKNTKSCALICIDEIIASNPEPWIGGNAEWEINYLLFPDYTHVSAIDYWKVVKKEINKL